MSKDLRKLIREAFTSAYKNHKLLSEDSEQMKSTMSSGDVMKVEDVFRKITVNPNLAIQYAWVPQGSANKQLNPAQFNLLAEMIVEKSNPMMKKNLMMSLYGQNNQDLYNKAMKRIMATLNVHISKTTMENAFLEGWAQMFLDTPSKEAGVERKQNFDDIVAGYMKLPAEKRVNFGAYIAETLSSNILNAYRDDMIRTKGTTSINAPSQTTGKETDFGSAEDFGSDTMNAPGVEDAYAETGANVDNPETLGSIGDDEEETPVDDSVIDLDNTDDFENTEEFDGESDPNIAGVFEPKPGEMSDKEEDARKKARFLIAALLKSINQAVKEFRQWHEPSESQQKGLLALEKLMTGERPKELSAKLGYNITTSIQDLKKSKEFTRVLDDYLVANGFINSRGKVESFLNMSPIYIADAVKYFKTGDASITKDLETYKDTWRYTSPEEIRQAEKDLYGDSGQAIKYKKGTEPDYRNSNDEEDTNEFPIQENFLRKSFKKDTFWFFEDILFEQFITESKKELLERVQKRLMKK